MYDIVVHTSPTANDGLVRSQYLPLDPTPPLYVVVHRRRHTPRQGGRGGGGGLDSLYHAQANMRVERGII